MKLCNVAFENINSLGGKWKIDFEDAAFQDGLFLITGDTGSGKTTILDAISLALYGRTVREKISKEQNEVMTRGRGIAWAEAEFVCESGRFRTRWEQQRARSKANGNLQKVAITLFDCDQDKDISDHRPSETQKMIQKLIGLTFEQFQRTMMLAQGKFDQFISAEEKDRSEILQQTTGTEIYSRVGEGIFRAKRTAEESVNVLATRLGEVQILEKEQRAELEANCLKQREETEALGMLLAAAQKQLGELKQKQATLAETERTVKIREKAIETTETALTSKSAEVVARREQETVARKTLEETEPIIKKAIELKQRLALAVQDRENKEKSLADAKKSLKTEQKSVAKLEKTLQEDGAIAAMFEAALVKGEFEAPAKVPAAKQAWVAKTEQFIETGMAFDIKNAVIAKLNKNAEAAALKFQEVDAKYKVVQPERKVALDNARAALDLAKIVAKLETHRKQLEDGKPCPLCGALEHPYAVGNKPEKSTCQKAYEAAEAALEAIETERNQALAAQQETARKLNEEKNAVAEEQVAYEQLKREIEHALSAIKGQTQTNNAALDEARAKVAELEEAVATKTKAANESAKETETIQNAIDELGLRKDAEKLRDELQSAYNAAKEATANAVAEESAARANAANAKTELETARRQCSEAERALAEFVATIAEPEKLAERVQALQDRKTELDQAIGSTDALLKHDDEQRDKRVKLLDELEKAKTSFFKWDNLNDWLGGANGEKFKRYAQGITLRELIRHANPHLKAMTQNRYEMTWDPEGQEAAKLLPFVVDKDQGGETRPMTNLSGGERFQISLALALGLSEMTSDRLSVDSLFLDEGFGTLDGKTLEAALDTLCRIQQNGKLIGIISHVTEVGERIPTQIKVNKIGGGLSTLTGAGVKKSPAVGSASR